MPRLIVQDAETGTRIIELKPGLNRLGRDEENDHVLPDHSVSRFHCEIHVDGAGVWVRDLGSANGTYLDSEPTQEAALQPGQKLCFGSVECLYDGDSEPVPSPNEAPVPPLPPPIRIAVETAETRSPTAALPVAYIEDECSQHAGIPAAFICQKCANRFCPACVKTRRVGINIVRSCPLCSGFCVSVDDYQKAVSSRDESFFTLVPGAFSFPLKENGPVMLVGGAIFFSMMQWARYAAQYAFIFGFSALLILSVVSVGYLYSFMRDIIVSAANGEQKMPNWPEISSFWEDMGGACFQFVVTCGACVGPGLVVMIWSSQIWGGGLLLVGLFCLPMALLLVSLADSVAALRPVLVFSSIAKAPAAYLVTVLIFLLFLAVRAGSVKLLDLLPIKFLPTVLLNLVGLYGLIVEMRVLGLFYHKYKAKLAWF